MKEIIGRGIPLPLLLIGKIKHNRNYVTHKCHTIPDDKPIKKGEIIQQHPSIKAAFPLHDAIRTGDITLLGQLLKKGTSVNTVNVQDQIYLDQALLDNYPDRALSLLLNRSGNVDGIDMRCYQTPLLYAVMHNSAIDLIKLLVNHGAHMDEVDVLNQTILHHALMHNSSIDTIRFLLKHSSVDPITLLDHEVDTDSISHLKQLILHYALKNNHPPLTIRLLLAKGANANVEDDSRITPLHLAVMNKYLTATIQDLLDHGVDMHAIDNEKETPLDYALCEDNTELIKLFANHSVTASKAKFNNTTPLDRLVIIGENILEEHRNNINNHYNKSNCVIIDYTSKNATDLLKMLSNLGMHVDAHTCIEIHAHGSIRADEKHEIQLAQVIPTGSFFVYLREIMQVPLWINLFSCHAGVAHQAIHSLGAGSSLITYCDAKLSTISERILYASKSLMAATPYESMIYNWKNCAINPVTISGMTGTKETTYDFMHPTEFVNKVLDPASKEKSLHDIVYGFFIEACDQFAKTFPTHQDEIIAARDDVVLTLSEHAANKYISGVLCYIAMHPSPAYSLKFDLFAKALQKKGFNMNDTIDDEVENPLQQSIASDNTACTKILLQYGSDPNQIGSNQVVLGYCNDHLRKELQAGNIETVRTLLRYNKGTLFNEHPTNQKRFRFDNIDFLNAIMYQVDKIDHDMPVTYPDYKKIQRFSLYEKYLILLDPKLVKEIYDKIKTNASPPKITDCIRDHFALSPKKKIVEDIFHEMMRLTQHNNLKKESIPIATMMVLLYTLDYDILVSKKEEIKNQFSKIANPNQSINRSRQATNHIANQLNAYIHTLFEPDVSTTKDDQTTDTIERRNRFCSACG